MGFGDVWDTLQGNIYTDTRVKFRLLPRISARSSIYDTICYEKIHFW
jgi:hypothetical protein